ncbi:MAM and LDL-receptor class A domain-containing protein 1-like isoform X1 [Patella vulgata]|uniref:MAM and LDL-receptor class A domain-containing protein 1-like isoform X1 n=1 Tax=Patella vulgata TaxID=6465 RepID=UPI0021807F0A|nr:MAM and LDL-receptor class A domain-containing protein 1-like isoform X1 [Patella vulgata]
MIGSRLYTTLWITIFAGLVSSQSCDFESDFCGWTNEASAIWERLNTATETTSTGPDRGHTTNTTNYFAYLNVRDYKDVNKIVIPNTTAVLVSESLSINSDICFRFYYHMYGAAINRLSMGILNDSKKQQMFIKTGDQNNSWHCGSFDVQTTVNTKIYIEAVTGENIFGDIAIDDLEIIQGKCNSSCGTISPDSPTTLPSNIITNSTSPVRSSPTTQPGNPGTTKETFNPVTDNILIYATCIPIAVLILIGVVAFICYKNKKKPEIFQPPRYGRRISNIQYQSYDRPVEEEETYDYIDDNQMRENQTDLGNPDYQTLPEDGGYILPPPPPPPPPCGPTTYIQAINGSDDPDDSVRF